MEELGVPGIPREIGGRAVGWVQGRVCSQMRRKVWVWSGGRIREGLGRRGVGVGDKRVGLELEIEAEGDTL